MRPMRTRFRTLTTALGILALTGLAAVSLRSQDVSLGGSFLPAVSYVLGGTWTFKQASPFVFEGQTDDFFETTLAVTDPTADRIITLPNATDTLVGLATSDSLSNKTYVAPILSGSVTGTYTLAGTPTLSVTFAGAPTFSGNVTFSGNPTLSGSVAYSGRLLARESFDQPHIVLEEDFTAKVLTDGGINVVLGSPSGVVEFREELGKTASSWVEVDGLLNISADDTVNDEGVEIYLGDDDDATSGWIVALTTGLCFNVNYTIALIAGTDQFVIGWRQNEAFQDVAAYQGYSDWSVVGQTNVDGSIFAQHEVAGGGTLSDDSGTNTTNASTHTLQSCIGTGGVPTASLDGTAITLTNGGTAHTTAIQMNPFISYLQAGGAVDANIRINYWEIVALP